MNRFQTELAKLSLTEEKRILKELEKQYKQALDDINAKIAGLLGREDVENKSSIIYQLQYQNALKKQISGILDNLSANQYTSITDYLENCYKNNYIGVMYDIANQGIPLIVPINQENVIRALTIDSKISEGLYKRLGNDVNELKKEIRNEVSRGIANNFSYADIARNIRIRGDVAKNKAYRIARTEGHRVQESSKYDAQLEAKSKGADVVKQWDATQDKRTRKSHAELDGKIVEVEEPFTYNGYEAMYPGGFGVPSLDINCRCTILQRAKWELDEEELEVMKERAKYYGLDKTKDFEEFKNKYLETYTDKPLEIVERNQFSSMTQYEVERRDIYNRNSDKKPLAYYSVDERQNLTDDDLRFVDLSETKQNEIYAKDLWSKYQKGIATQDNFFYETYAKFDVVSKRPKGTPSFVSRTRDGKVSSEYWYTPEGVIRGSDHWGNGIASCDWYLNSEALKQNGITITGKKYGFCKWEDFLQKTGVINIDGDKYLTNFVNTIGKKTYLINGRKYYYNSMTHKYELIDWDDEIEKDFIE